MHTDTLDLMLQRELPVAAAGCQQAYGRIVRACQNTVTAIALAITRDIAASEDIAQEAFLRAWQRLAQLHQPASFLPWLRQITRNLARDWLRANRHRALSGEAADLAIAMAADPAPSPADQLLQVEEEIAAFDIISALPEESRETLLLFYREGQSSRQVASLLGLSDAAVRKRLSRARASVRGELLRRFGE
ncbi:RNA polymerase sigma factor, partial [Xanthomonas arboricola]